MLHLRLYNIFANASSVFDVDSTLTLSLTFRNIACWAWQCIKLCGIYAVAATRPGHVGLCVVKLNIGAVGGYSSNK